MVVAHDYTILRHKEGVVRVGAVKYDLSDLSDNHVHLSNHCIAATHPDYGKYEGEPTNEVFFARFRLWLAEAKPGTDFDRDVLPQIDRITTHTLLAAKHELETADYQAATTVSFQLWGLDFLLDADCGVTLLEANVSPACADGLLPFFAEDFVEV